MSDLQTIPDIGKTFAKDFARIGITQSEHLIGQDPETLFHQLCAANLAENHPTSKNYLYVIRLAVYYAQGGRAPASLHWSAWKSPPSQDAART